jgi:hypothetical protein
MTDEDNMIATTRMRMIPLTALLTLVANFAIAQGTPFGGQLQVNGETAITFTANTISCSGLSPGDAVSLAGFMIDRQGGSRAIITPAFSQQADTNGFFTVTVDGGVRPESIWLLIDQTAGSYTVAEPAGSVLRLMPAGSVSVNGDVATINRAHTHVFWISKQYGSGPSMDVRRRGNPGAESVRAQDSAPPGFSIFDAKDGAGSDDDGTINGIVHLRMPSFSDSTSQSTSCLFVVDERTFEFTVVYLIFNHNGTRCPQTCS